jgi:predicted Zn-dependent protease
MILLAAGGLLVAAWFLTAAPPTPSNGSTPADAVAAIVQDAENLRLQAEPDKAETLLRKAFAETPDQRIAIALGELLVSVGKTEDAYGCYQQAISIGPSDATLEFVAGTLASKLGRPDEAEVHYAAGQRLDPADHRMPLFLAQIQVKQNKTAEAKANLLLAEKLKPDQAIIWGTLAEISIRENSLDLALQHVRKARDLEPRSIVWRIVEGRALKRQNKPEEALQLFIGLPPAEQLEEGVVRIMAECYGMLGKVEDAANLYVAASDAAPSNGTLALEASRWLEQADRKSDALAHAQRASMLATPGADEVVTRLKQP